MICLALLWIWILLGLTVRPIFTNIIYLYRRTNNIDFGLAMGRRLDYLPSAEEWNSRLGGIILPAEVGGLNNYFAIWYIGDTRGVTRLIHSAYGNVHLVNSAPLRQAVYNWNSYQNVHLIWGAIPPSRWQRPY